MSVQASLCDVGINDSLYVFTGVMYRPTNVSLAPYVGIYIMFTHALLLFAVENLWFNILKVLTFSVCPISGRLEMESNYL